MIPEMELIKAEQRECGTVRRTKGLTSEEVSYIGGAWQRVGSSFHGILSSTMRGIDQLSRRGALGILGGAAIAGTTAVASTALDLDWLISGAGVPAVAANLNVPLLEEIERRAFQFFWEQACGATGLVMDRAATDGDESRVVSSIAATGFGLTALCIGDSRGYKPTTALKQRVISTLDFFLSVAPSVNGFYYHFMDINTGAPVLDSEVSSIDTAILLCGALTCREYFQDAQIASLATQLYNRVNWEWMLNGGSTLSQGWTPQNGMIKSRWDSYCELMMLYLLAIGSPANPIPASSWRAWTRPVLEYQGLKFITANAPLFTHQFSHAWIDFRDKRDAFANYFTNSVIATQAHKLFCLSLRPQFSDYANDFWGISASDSVDGYVAWGGPPIMGPIDGTLVPSATAGSIPFLPAETIAVQQYIYKHFSARAWTRYGFVNAFNPLTGWYDPDVIGICQGITMLMIENYRSEFVWKTFMKNPEINKAMELVGFEAG